jgi:integrase
MRRKQTSRPSRYGERFAVDGVTLGRRGRKWIAEYRDAAGARRRLSLSATTEAAAKTELQRFAESRKAVQRQRATYTVGQLWDLWLADRAEDGFSNSIYSANWVSLELKFSHRDPALITKADCRAYARARFDLGRSPWTVVTELSRLRACLAWAVDSKHLDQAPYIWLPQKGKGRTRVLSYDEARQLLVAARAGDPHMLVFVVLALQTAARHTAILDLTWDRVDWIKGEIAYDEALKPDPMSKSWRKGRAKVPMAPLTRATLELAFSGRQSGHVVEHAGRRLKTVRSGFAAAVARAGLDDGVTPHTLRHTVATWIKERGFQTSDAAKLLGHADSRTTELVYTHTDAGRTLRPVVDVMDAELVAKPKGKE